MRNFFSLQNIKYEASSFLRIHNAFWQLICLCSSSGPENQMIFEWFWDHLGVRAGPSGIFCLSSVRRSWWGLNPSAGTPPLHLFFFRPDKRPGLPSCHNPTLHLLILSSGKMDPWVRIGAWEFYSFRVCTQGSHNKYYGWSDMCLIEINGHGTYKYQPLSEHYHLKWCVNADSLMECLIWARDTSIAPSEECPLGSASTVHPYWNL